MARDSVVFYRSFYEAVKELDEADQIKVYNALFAYALDGEDPELSGVPAAIFKLMRPSVDSNNQKFENGSKGGRPKKPNHNQSETEPKPNHNQSETEPKPYEDEDGEEDEDESVDEAVDEDGDSFILADGSAFRLPPARVAEFAKTFPEVNVKAELLRCRLKHNALRQRRNALTIEQYIVNWLINAQGDAKKARSGTFGDIPTRSEPVGKDFLKGIAGRNGNLV